MLRSSSWSTARQPSHKSALANGSTISAINVRIVTWKGMERRDPFMSPRVDWPRVWLGLLPCPLAAEILLRDREGGRSHRQIGDKMQVESAKLVAGLVD